MKGAVWQFPEIKEYTNDILQLNKLTDIDTTLHGTDLKTIAYHPTDSKKTVSVVDNNFVLWDLSNEGPQVGDIFNYKIKTIYYFIYVSFKKERIPSFEQFSLFYLGCGIGYFGR